METKGLGVNGYVERPGIRLAERKKCFGLILNSKSIYMYHLLTYLMLFRKYFLDYC